MKRHWVIKDSHGCYWSGRGWYHEQFKAAMFPSYGSALNMAMELEEANEEFSGRVDTLPEELKVVKVNCGVDQYSDGKL